MKSRILIVLLVFAIALSGCVEPAGTVCGNGVCEDGETDLSCPEDCPSYHLECVNQKCTVVEGLGEDQCIGDSDCQSTAGGIGESFTTAIVIEADNEEDGIAMEYDWLYYNGCSNEGGVEDIVMQELQEQGNHMYDLLQVVCVNGAEKVYYFQIDSFFGK